MQHKEECTASSGPWLYSTDLVLNLTPSSHEYIITQWDKGDTERYK